MRLAPSAASALRSAPPAPKRALREAFRSLANDPYGSHRLLDVKRLDVARDPGVFRLRVGDWRAAYVVTPTSVDIVRVFHRSEGYVWLDEAGA